MGRCQKNIYVQVLGKTEVSHRKYFVETLSAQKKKIKNSDNNNNNNNNLDE